jgi:hypothetical protein
MGCWWHHHGVRVATTTWSHICFHLIAFHFILPTRSRATAQTRITRIRAVKGPEARLFVDPTCRPRKNTKLHSITCQPGLRSDLKSIQDERANNRPACQPHQESLARRSPGVWDHHQGSRTESRPYPRRSEAVWSGRGFHTPLLPLPLLLFIFWNTA